MGYGSMRGPGDFTPDDPDERVDERAEELETELRADAKRLEEIDRDASELLSGSQYEDLFAALADADDSGLIQKLAEGDPLTALQQKHLDVFARVARLAKDMATAREAAIAKAAHDQAERESLDWAPWKGTSSATAAWAHAHGWGEL